MKFNEGDIVVCTAPVGSLEHGSLYTVVGVNIPINAEAHPENISLLLEGIKDPYYSYRFKLHQKSNGNPAPVASKLIDKITEDNVHRNNVWDQHPEIKYPINDVDSGMLAPPKAAKNDSSKVDLSLIPRISNIEHAKAFMVGEKKYGRYNYCKGHKSSQLVAAAKRHLDAWFEGEENDPTDGQHHLGSVMACCSMLLRQQELGTLIDDRFKDANN